MENLDIARHLDEVARLLEAQGANPFRVRAYRTAAARIRELKQPLKEILHEEGPDGLLALPGIGQSLAAAIEQLVKTGRLPLLERLRGDMQPERVFTTLANIGPELARRIHETLDIETLSELQAAALDGRLARVAGMGPKRLRAVRESLAGRFRRRLDPEPERIPSEPAEQPPVDELLEIDQQYRRLSDKDRLPRVAPRRFNPTGQAWLPILHTERGDRHYTALFSNTARAHELGATHDWVVIYLDDHEHHGQWTVITAGFGALKGRRIVRGREAECAEHYERVDEAAERETKARVPAGRLF